MKKIIFLLTGLLLSGMIAYSQLDSIVKHNGDVLKGKVIRIAEYTVVFSYENETSENTISKYAVDKIIYGQSKRIETVSEKIIINGEDDWEKVILLEDKSNIVGLKKQSDVRGKTALINFHTGNTGDKKALMKLKKEAAKLKCPFLYVTADKTTVGASSNTLGGTQAIKTGAAYSY